MGNGETTGRDEYRYRNEKSNKNKKSSIRRDRLQTYNRLIGLRNFWFISSCMCIRDSHKINGKNKSGLYFLSGLCSFHRSLHFHFSVFLPLKFSFWACSDFMDMLRRLTDCRIIYYCLSHTVAVVNNHRGPVYQLLKLPLPLCLFPSTRQSIMVSSRRNCIKQLSVTTQWKRTRNDMTLYVFGLRELCANTNTLTDDIFYKLDPLLRRLRHRRFFYGCQASLDL